MKKTQLLIASALAACLGAHAGGTAADAGTAAQSRTVAQTKSTSTLTRADAAKCTGTQCTVTVRAADCTLGASPHYLIVTGRNVVVRWVIQDKGYTFPEKDGIFFKKGSADARSEFERCGRVNERTWQCLDKNANPPMAYWYGINVLKPDKSACKTLDPTIINDMATDPAGGG